MDLVFLALFGACFLAAVGLARVCASLNRSRA